jgi:trans-aconitate methyltransferase
MTERSTPPAEQFAYYRAVAAEYEDHAIDAPGADELVAAIDLFRPTGDVLELACGTGVWTEHLLRSAATITAVDGAPEMLAQATNRVGEHPAVTFIEADLFRWRPSRRYDTVFFGFWISHVPAHLFESFWSLVDDALAPDGDVFFFDDNHRTEDELVEGAGSAVVERRLNDGTAFRVIKIPYTAADLESRLRELDWDISVRATAGPFYWGHGRRT